MNSTIPESYASKCERFYERTKDRIEPRSTLRQAVLAFKEEKSEELSALDLGCGVGLDARYMAEEGWKVTAIDSQILASEYLYSKLPKKLHSKVVFVLESFETMALSQTFTLVNASRSLPFCNPESFPSVMKKVLAAVAINGRFAGHFCGPNDDWAKTGSAVIVTEEELRAYFSNFTIERFKQREWDGTIRDKPKHWHLFSIVAKKV